MAVIGMVKHALIFIVYLASTYPCLGAQAYPYIQCNPC